MHAPASAKPPLRLPPLPRPGRPLFERRRHRPDDTASALVSAFDHAVQRAELDVLIVTDESGILVSNSTTELDLAMLAAVTPLVARGSARANVRRDVPEAVMIADMFLAEGVLVRTRGRGGQILREERAHPDGSDCDMPLVVLQDHGSASASELLAVALQDHGRARVVGERSYGKGTVQDVIGMHDGSQLTLTIARYFSPKDRLIDGNGVEPDVPLPAGGSAGIGATTDSGLELALAELVRGPGAR